MSSIGIHMKTYLWASLFGLVPVIALVGSAALRAADTPSSAPPPVLSTKAVAQIQDPTIMELRTRVSALEKRNAKLEADALTLNGRLAKLEADAPALENRVHEIEENDLYAKSDFAEWKKDVEGHTHSYWVQHFDGIAAISLTEHFPKYAPHVELPIFPGKKGLKTDDRMTGPMETWHTK